MCCSAAPPSQPSLYRTCFSGSPRLNAKSATILEPAATDTQGPYDTCTNSRIGHARVTCAECSTTALGTHLHNKIAVSPIDLDDADAHAEVSDTVTGALGPENSPSACCCAQPSSCRWRTDLNRAREPLLRNAHRCSQQRLQLGVRLHGCLVSGHEEWLDAWQCHHLQVWNVRCRVV